MRIILLLGLMFSVVSCSPAPFKPEVMHPSPERMRELLDAPNPVRKNAPGSKFDLTVSRPVLLLGQTLTVTCYTPASMDAREIFIAVLDAAQSGPKTVSAPQTILEVPDLGCGQWTALCAVSTPTGMKRIERTVEVKGGMCDAVSGSDSSAYGAHTGQ